MKILFSFITLYMIIFLYGCMSHDAVNPQSLLKEESTMATIAQTIYIDPDTGMPTNPPAGGVTQPQVQPQGEIGQLAAPIILDESTEANGMTVYTPRAPVSKNLIARQDCLKNIRISHQHSIDFSKSKSTCSFAK